MICCNSTKNTGGKKKIMFNTLPSEKSIRLHYLQLKQALDLGLVLDRVVKVLQFYQSPWIKQYIDLNTVINLCFSLHTYE